MAMLADHIAVASRFARSANLERDVSRPEPLDGYVVTARALDVVERIATAAAADAAGGAWSITGPYGSGKSSLALLLDAAFAEAGPTRDIAWVLIDDASPSVAQRIREAHKCHDTQRRGFHRGLVTASREPLTHTVLRALHSAVLRAFGKIPSIANFPAAKVLKGALRDAASDDPRRTGPSPAALLEIARCLADDAPLLLIIDEFGKNLEAIRDGGDADPYLLQQLAEAGQGSGLPIFILTLQHLSFEDYLAGTDGPQHREWAKVQGRFEDIPYVESATQTRALIGTVFDIADDSLGARITAWAESQAKAMSSLGLADLADPALVRSCYPLHPLTAAVLPELCSRYGQHERTLFSFLSGPDPATAASFLATTELTAQDPLPTLGLDAVYDYFVTGGALSAVTASQSSRWTEIATRIRDTHGLSERQATIAKATAVLNLVSTGGTIRASRPVLALAEVDVEDILGELEAIGIVTYREFADEYRIWHGTDVDIRRLLDIAHERAQRRPLIDILSTIGQPKPIVAARHSAEHHVLRVFSQRYAESIDAVEPLSPFSPYDGEVLLIVDSDRSPPSTTSLGDTAKPVVVAIPHDLTELDAAAREVAAIADVLGDDTVSQDWVARRELGERLAEARVKLEHATVNTFSTAGCRWSLVGSRGVTELEVGRGTAALSAAADRAYRSTPTIRNEMLNRNQLTSQGAKARRLLLEAMIERGGEPGLGFTGYGPEVAMYSAFLAQTELHGRDDRNNIMTFRNPTDPSLVPAWEVLESEFKRAKNGRINLNDIAASLLLPPIGLKAAVIPVLVTAGLLAHSDEIAIYEHGTFKPLFTADLSERMVRNASHFDIKHFANTTGARRHVIDALANRLDVHPRFRKHRVANVLAIVGHLVSEVRRLDNYTRRTDNLDPSTLKAREALMAAVEPDTLLFDTLPTALGFEVVGPDTKTYERAESYAEAVHDVLGELTGNYGRLLDELLKEMLAVSAESSRLAISGQATALEDEILDPAVRAFVLTLANAGVETDADWIKAIATVLAKKAPAEWSDEDRERFRREIPHQISAFQRLVALHAGQRAAGGGPFDALRVTITRSDGSEFIRLVAVDHEHRPALEFALDGILDDLSEITGSNGQGRQSLLALLSERLLSDLDGANDISIDVSRERSQHG